MSNSNESLSVELDPVHWPAVTARRLLVLLLLLGLCLASRGLIEAFEGAASFAHDHAAEGVDHSDSEHHSDIEHGCVGHQHVCPCCSSTPIDSPPPIQIALWARAECGVLEPMSLQAGPSGIQASLFRPPIA